MGPALNVDLPHLQVAMETKQDVVGVAVKVEQCGHQRCQNSELIDLQRKPKKKKKLIWAPLSVTDHSIRLNFLYQVMLILSGPSGDSRHSAAAQTCSPLPALWTSQTFPRPAGALLLGLSRFVASCSQSPAADCSPSSADTAEPTRTS